MMHYDKDFVIFYSWQSDLPEKTNLKAIRSALRAASSLVEEGSDVRVVLDEATRGESGSPNIPATIVQKISACDVFVCDLTTINNEAGNSYRKTPNPNVLFELGYAVSTLGWGRIVMLFNKHFGSFPDDLPFDIDRHRASPYLISEEDPKNKSNISNLQLMLKAAIDAVVLNNPLRPTEALKSSPEELKRNRDIEKLTWALSTIHLPTVDEMISDLPRYLNGKVFHFWESFRGTVCNSLFYIYDEKASNLVTGVLEGWSGCLSHGEEFRMGSNPHISIFSNPGDAPLSDKQEESWEHINDSRALLKNSLDQLIEYIRNDYLEIDVDELSSNAWKSYVEYERMELESLDV